MTPVSDHRLPLGPLLALAMAAFITILTEVLPAGLLPQMAQDLAVSEAWVGQTITLYAIGSLLAAIPLTAATQGIRRRPLLMAAILGFAIANTVTTFSGHFWLTMAARFLAGMSAGLMWALLAGYAARMVPGHQQGRAIAIAMVGTPLALSLGVPAGTFLGTLVSWRVCFGIMSTFALILMVWVRVQVPDFAGQAKGQRRPLAQVFRLPGVRPVLFVVLAFVLAHNILYTYIAPFLATLYQTALTKTAGDAADVAQSMLVTAWNMAIAGGGIIGGVLLSRSGVGAFPPVLLALLAATPVVVWVAKRHGFPAVT